MRVSPLAKGKGPAVRYASSGLSKTSSVTMTSSSSGDAPASNSRNPARFTPGCRLVVSSATRLEGGALTIGPRVPVP